jgi:hypothetical protein
MKDPIINSCYTGYKSSSYARAVFYAHMLYLFRMNKQMHGNCTEEEAYEALDNWQRWKI